MCYRLPMAFTDMAVACMALSFFSFLVRLQKLHCVVSPKNLK